MFLHTVWYDAWFFPKWQIALVVIYQGVKRLEDVPDVTKVFYGNVKVVNVLILLFVLTVIENKYFLIYQYGSLF